MYPAGHTRQVVVASSGAYVPGKHSVGATAPISAANAPTGVWIGYVEPGGQ